MFMKSKDIEGLRLRGPDGDVGRLEDLLVDEQWVVRYLVVMPGSWIRQRVVISPISITGLDWADRRVDVRLTQQQIRDSPDLLAVSPLTRGAEAAYARYYGFPAYWGGPGLWAWAGRPGALDSVPPQGYVPPPPDIDATASGIRSARSFRGRHLMARDGEIGHVDNCIVEDDSWTLPYFLIDTSNWIGGRHVLVPTAAVREVDTVDRELGIDLSVERIRSAPEYDADLPLDSTLESLVRSHYEAAAQPTSAPQPAVGRRAGR
jgi:hypothetical protein